MRHDGRKILWKFIKNKFMCFVFTHQMHFLKTMACIRLLNQCKFTFLKLNVKYSVKITFLLTNISMFYTSTLSTLYFAYPLLKQLLNFSTCFPFYVSCMCSNEKYWTFELLFLLDSKSKNKKERKEKTHCSYPNTAK